MEKTALARIIRERRAVKKGYTDKPVKEETVLELLEDAVWAPNHGMREPWRFIFVGPEQKANFAKQIAATYPEELRENRENYMNEPNAILIVIMTEEDIPKKWEENYGATAAMIQNFWLLAWERQLGVVWKTNPHIYHPQVKELLGLAANERVLGFLHLGYFEEQPIVKERISAKAKFTRFGE